MKWNSDDMLVTVFVELSYEEAVNGAICHLRRSD